MSETVARESQVIRERSAREVCCSVQIAPTNSEALCARMSTHPAAGEDGLCLFTHLTNIPQV